MRLVALGSRLEAAGHKPPTLNLTAHSLQPMAAASRFGRYGPMGRQEVDKQTLQANLMQNK